MSSLSLHRHRTSSDRRPHPHRTTIFTHKKTRHPKVVITCLHSDINTHVSTMDIQALLTPFPCIWCWGTPCLGGRWRHKGGRKSSAERSRAAGTLFLRTDRPPCGSSCCTCVHRAGLSHRLARRRQSRGSTAHCTPAQMCIVE